MGVQRKPKKSLKTEIVAKSEGQQDVIDALRDKRVKYVAISGEAGTGKTHLTAHRAAQGLLRKEFGKLYLTRSVTPIRSEEIGFLKGTVEEKMAGWVAPMVFQLKKFLPNVQELMEKRVIEVIPLAQLRGMSCERCFFWATEAQNLTYESIEAILTRIDEKSKCVLEGDFAQNDRYQDETDFERVCNCLSDLEVFEWLELGSEDQVRSRHITEILDKLHHIK